MIGSIPIRTPCELGTFPETFCPACRDIILDPDDRDESVRCEGDGSSPVTCESILHRSCAEIIDGEFACPKCKVLDRGAEEEKAASVNDGRKSPLGKMPSVPADGFPQGVAAESFYLASSNCDDTVQIQISAGTVAQPPPQSAGSGIHGGPGPTLRIPLRDVTSHHLAQAIVARALARDLRENRI